MATISLSPGETFVHEHSFPSTTTLLSGSVRIRIGDEEQLLERNVEALIPSSVEHALTNIGDTQAIVECAMCQPITPPPGR